MARRTMPVDPSIGERIQARRKLRRWSLRHAADRAGISHSTWSRIENGKLRTDRYILADLAAALECSVTDLTGQPYTPADRALEVAHARVDVVWRAMMAHPLTEPATGEAQPTAALTAETDLVRDLYNRCDYAGALDRLAALLPHLHSATRGPEPDRALALMVPAYGVAMGSLLNLGYPAHAWLAVERCREAAQRLEDPVALALAATNSARVSSGSGAYGPARSTAERAANDLQHRLSEPTALETLGFLHLSNAHHCIGAKDIDAANEHLAEAARIAERTGETTSWDLLFGPSNVALWQMSIELDTGRPGEATETARRVRVADLPAARTVYFYIDMARALLDLRRYRDALRMLSTAERVAPQFTRSATAARITARALLERSAGAELRGLCERMGVGH